jgi:ubiquitin thioesterase OTU1
MRVRLKGPGGTATLSLDDDDTVGDLIDQIAEKTSVSSFEVKYGYPPKPLLLGERRKQLKDLGVKLNGESLTISPKEDPAASKDTTSDNQSMQDEQSPSKTTQKRTEGTASAPSVSFAGMNSSEPKKKTTKPVSLQKKAMEGEVPEIPLPECGATLGKLSCSSHSKYLLIVQVLRVMPDDNSCLFRAFSTAVVPTGDDNGMPEIRALIAGYIQKDPEKYTKIVLEQPPDDYCRWIQTEDAWGGFIEMDILAKHFDIQICSIDVQARP